ncbi:putative splicing factor U2AF [Spironucleus salmonicida]|uniref:Splicing factor U2AF n=1 Tax=Spironucleus salmonicida TaxID=348837 RepID=V6LKM6_9EUKA|nr:putative splicing factor U2AF [Spironucleus salmonicida]KAH0570372.1 putative splicing factor U2AF [Spironucleus salmonicida]|eukprot:EST44281.1 Putative splicing factor U2AF [Spironucleus salmonicida]
MTCEFFATIGCCKYDNACSRHHIAQESSNLVVIPNLCPLTKSIELNEQLLLQSVKEIVRFASENSHIVDFTVAVNNNHLYGTVYLLFESIIAANAFVLSLPKAFSGKDIVARFLPHKVLKPIFCNVRNCDGYFCQKVHEKFFSRKDILD